MFNMNDDMEIRSVERAAGHQSFTGSSAQNGWRDG